jgi:cytochrome oxidase Cu insertion factor (SCO1/SenC/PrrC family)
MSNPGVRSARLKLLAIFLVSLSPVILSYLTYYVWRPTSFQTYGEMLPIRPVPAFEATDMQGKPASLAVVKGKWALVMVDDAACAKSCNDTLFAIRQIRTAQGKEIERIARVWLVQGASTPQGNAEFTSGVQVLRLNGQDVRLPVPQGGNLRDYIYLVDPLGNQVMRYARTADPVKIIRELAKFLKHNEAIG